MTCESVTATLGAGRLLSDAEEAHLADCRGCKRLVAAIRTWQPEAVMASGPRVPSVLQLEATIRRERVRGAALAAAALVVLTLGGLGLRGLLDAPGGAAMDEFGHPILTTLAPVPSTGPSLEGAEGAAPASPVDDALVALVGSLDRLDADRTELADAPLVAMLDPFGDDPVADPLTGNSAEGDL